MAGKRVALKAVDWVKLGSTMPKAAVGEFNAFRTRHETIKGSLETLTEKPVPINWSFYQSNIKNAALVEKLQAAYSKVSVPVPQDTESATIAVEEKQIEADIAVAMKAKKEKIATLQEQILAIKAQKPFEELSTDEFIESQPQLKKEIDAEIREIGWR